jgi:hypothetical protein
MSHGAIMVMVVIAGDNAEKLAAETLHKSLPEYAIVQLAVVLFFLSFFFLSFFLSLRNVLLSRSDTSRWHTWLHTWPSYCNTSGFSFGS